MMEDMNNNNNTNNNKAIDIKENKISLSTSEVPSVCRWYDKWSAINDEDGVVSR